ncbi:riboflavin synthase [bacterium MnTg02]|nr:riboflavin synthase [bacterium MnTg02]
MFTGLISDIGTIRTIDGQRYAIGCHYDAATLQIGASIACDGCCLTVTYVAEPADTNALIWVDASNETLERTTLGSWRLGQRINLERSLTLSAELGGHIVTGHIDGVAEIAEKRADGNSFRYDFICPDHLMKFIAPKGSVALNGTSLTVNNVTGNKFGINLIPHTLSATTWGEKQSGDCVNLEVDLVARYVARIISAAAEEGLN